MDLSPGDILTALSILGGLLGAGWMVSWRVGRFFGKTEGVMQAIADEVKALHEKDYQQDQRIDRAERHIAVCPLVADQRVKLVADTGVPGVAVTGVSRP